MTIKTTLSCILLNMGASILPEGRDKEKLEDVILSYYIDIAMEQIIESEKHIRNELI